ncbi:MAG: M15 family metallopeptidase [Pseudomonadota bacterium]
MSFDQQPISACRVDLLRRLRRLGGAFACLVVIATTSHAVTTLPATAKDAGSIRPISDAMWQAMVGVSWHRGRGCTQRSGLRLLTVPYVDFSGAPQTGHLIVARDVARGVLSAFARMRSSGFRIARMEPVHVFGGSDARSMAANNTSGFNCRLKSSGRGLSEHAKGRAIDINPVQNPYVSRRGIFPPAGRTFATRVARRRGHIGLITRGGAAHQAFRSIGWGWGGNWRRLKDYQHFSKSGR